MRAVTLLPEKKKIPVGKILCLGKNYAEHAKEFGGDVPKSPMIFLKPPTAIIENGDDIILPPLSVNVHHEVELTVLVGATGKNIPKANAMNYVAGYGVGLDMTMRDKQSEAKKEGNPWSIAKGFDTSAPLSPFVPKATVADPYNLEIKLSVNRKQRQHSNTGKMIFKIDEIIAFLSLVFTLEEGDVIFTGTPEGVGQVIANDVIDAEIPGVGSLHHRVVAK
jgi:acylpyruvate hydrolase